MGYGQAIHFNKLLSSGQQGNLSYIAINKPNIGKEEKEAVMEVLDSGWLTDSSYEGGKKVREFEGKLRALLGSTYVIAVNSGTAALHSALLALGIKPGDEVIVPSFTFVATANVVLACGARPVFVDIRDDYNIDPAGVKRAITKRTRAVMPVHLYGYPAEMDEVNEIASAKGVAVVEDAAESLGAKYRGRQTGTIGDMGCFSMYSTKVATAGEGGAVSTDDKELAEKIRMVRNHGMVHGYDSRHLGFNYRMQEVTAAIASVQMDKLHGFLNTRKRNARYLNARFDGVGGADFRQWAEDRTHAFYLYTLYLKKNRDRVLKRLNNRGIGAAVYFRTPVHKNPLYSQLGYGLKSLKKTESASNHVVSLPVHPGVSTAEMSRVADEFLMAAHAYL